MLKQCLLALALAGLTYAVTPAAIGQDNGGNDQSAQAPGPGGEHMGRGHFDPEMRTQRLTRMLNLSSEQQAKVLEIFKSDKAQMESLHSDSSLSQADRHAKMMDLHKASDEQVRAVLNPGQQKKFDAMRERREERMQGHENGQAPPADSQPPQQPQQ